MNAAQLISLTALLSFLVACREKPVEPVAALPSTATNAEVAVSSNPQFYLVRGVVKKINLEESTVSIQHEEIPNFMPAMTMPFKVKQTNQLEGIAPGDSIWFVLLVTPDESWIDKITKDKKAEDAAPSAAAPEREGVRVVRDVEPLTVGDPMPNYTFTNELGRTVQLADFKGKALAFTFIFTRCPLPEFCPRMSLNFQEVQQKLQSRPNAPTNWHLLSISFDPHFDTPSVLRGYAQAFQNDPNRWNFVTGAIEDIDAITDQFELTIVKRDNDWDHKMRTVVVDANGRVHKIIYGNEWQPETLVDEILAAAGPAAAGEGG